MMDALLVVAAAAMYCVNFQKVATDQIRTTLIYSRYNRGQNVTKHVSLWDFKFEGPFDQNGKIIEPTSMFAYDDGFKKYHVTGKTG